MALGRLGDPLDAQCVLVEAHDAEGNLRAFLSFVPWGRNGLSLDLMRRDPTADNGLVELMVASLAERAAVFGIAYGAVQNLTLVVAFARARGHGASTVSAVWNAAFDTGTGIGAVVVGALAATGMGVPMALGVCAGLIAVCLPLAVMASSARHAPGRHDHQA